MNEAENKYSIQRHTKSKIVSRTDCQTKSEGMYSTAWGI